MTGVDVNLPLQIATLDASIGRKARLERPPQEGPECVPKPPSIAKMQQLHLSQRPHTLEGVKWRTVAALARYSYSNLFRSAFLEFVPPR